MLFLCPIFFFQINFSNLFAPNRKAKYSKVNKVHMLDRRVATILLQLVLNSKLFFFWLDPLTVIMVTIMK